MKLEKIVKQTNNKFLNMFAANYKTEDGKEYNYFFCSRRENKIGDLSVCDAVKVLPYIKETNEIIFIKNFRYAVNDYVYELPAGLVDANEDLIEAAKRELNEETGATAYRIEEMSEIGTTSAGLTDETIKLYYAYVKLDNKQNLDEYENIKVVKINVSDTNEFLKTHKVDIISQLMVEIFKKELWLSFF